MFYLLFVLGGMKFVIFTTVHKCQLLMMWRFLLSFNLFHSCLRNLLLSCLARRTLRAWLLITQSSSSSSSSSESPLNTDLYCTMYRAVLYCTALYYAETCCEIVFAYCRAPPWRRPGWGPPPRTAARGQCQWRMYYLVDVSPEARLVGLQPGEDVVQPLADHGVRGRGQLVTWTIK